MRFFLVAALLSAVSASPHALPGIGNDIDIAGSSQPPSDVNAELWEESHALSSREPKGYDSIPLLIGALC